MPKYRQRVLAGKIAVRVEALFRQCAEMNHWHIAELEIRSDHIHLLVQIGHDLVLSKVVQYFKGGSSRAIRQEQPELEEFLWGDSFWADGYFAETVGIANEELIRRYLRNQQFSSMPL